MFLSDRDRTILGGGGGGGGGYNHSGMTATRASCQIRKIVGCACAGDAGNVFPATVG